MRLEIEQSIESTTTNYYRQPVEETSSNGVDVSRLLKQGVSAAQSGERALARTLLLRVTEADPQNTDAWLWLASISEYPEELLGFLDNVLSVDPDNSRARQWKAATRSLLAKTFVQRGISANEDGQTQFAIDCFDKALEHDEQCEAALVWKASLMESENERESLLVRALEINPDNEDAKAALSAITGRREQLQLNAARTAAVNGDLSGAELILHQILANDADSIDAWLLMSQVAAPFSEKMLAYRRILELDPSNALANAGHDFISDMRDAVQAEDSDTEAAETVEGAEQFAAEPSTEGDQQMSADVEQFEETGYYENSIEPVIPEMNEPAESYDFLNDTEPDSVENETSQVDEMPEVDFQAAEETDHNGSYYHEEELAPANTEATMETDAFDSEQSDDEPSVAAGSMADDANAYDLGQRREFLSHASETPVVEEPAAEPEWPAEQPSDEVGQHFFAENDQIVEDVVPQDHCPYCHAANEPHAFECSSCMAILTLSDLERLLANSNPNVEAVQEAVTRMESEWNLREFTEQELTVLGIGKLNLNDPDAGFAYLQEASRLNPNNVILASQVNALAIRLDEIRRQNEVHGAMPKGKTILVVDDSATVRKLISSKLEKSGHNVVCAEDGVDAMSVLESTVPDLVLLDIAMPRMDGYSVCKLIRSNEATKEVPVVMISGKDGFFDKVRGRMAGTTGYITKPFGPETLMRALETYLLPEMAEND
ncbi:MAG: response regulator [Pyrinomonadaceae bacterium]|nr:response regulator [Pyrinomonadaceae bacterium]